METLHMLRDCFAVVVRVVVVFVTLITFVAPQPAGAEPSSKPAAVGMPVADGPIDTAVQVGNTLYVGGRFGRFGTSSGPFVTVAPGTGAVVPMAGRIGDGKGFVVISDGTGGWFVGGSLLYVDGYTPGAGVLHILADGSADPSFAPATVTGVITDLLIDSGRLYVAGDFIAFNGESRRGLVALDRTTGALQPFDPGLNGAVYALESSPSVLFLGGNFTDAGGTGRAGLAALDLVSQALLPWNPGVTGEVRALELVASTMYVGGTFTSAGGVSRKNLAAIQTSTNNATAWDPQASDTVLTFGLSSTTLIVGGEFTAVSGATRFHLAAYDTATNGLLAWAPNPNYYVHTVTPSAGGATVYVGGEFDFIAGVARAFAAEVALVDGTLTAWNPGPLAAVRSIALGDTSIGIVGFFGGIGAQTRLKLASIDLITNQLGAWTATVSGGNVRTMAYHSNTIYIGGDFIAINGTTRIGLAALDLGGTLTPWDPGANGHVNALAVTPDHVIIGGAFTAAGGMLVSNLAAVDRATGQPGGVTLGASGEVHTLIIDSGKLFVGGAFDAVAGVSRANVAALLTTGWSVDAWAPSTNGVVYDIDVRSDRVYIGGSFSMVNGTAKANIASVLLSGPGLLDENFIATTNGPVRALKATIGSLFVGGQFSNVNGFTRHGALTLTLDTGAFRKWHGLIVSSSVLSFLPTNAGMWVFGGYDRVSSEALQGLSFFPDTPPQLQPIADLPISEDQLATVTLSGTDEVLDPPSFGFTAASSNQSVIASSGLQVLFNGADWTLTISPVPNATGTATILVTMNDGLFTATRQFTVTVAPVSDQPVITGLSDDTIIKDTVSTQSFAVTDIDSTPNTINVSSATSNPALVPLANIVLDGGAEAMTITVTPLPGQIGSAVITVIANDGVSGNVSSSFTLTVVAGNTPPSITPIVNQVTTIGVAVGPLSFTVNDPEGGQLDVSASSSNLVLVPQAGLQLGGTESQRTITITPAPGQGGLATITLTVTDDLAGTSSTSFQLTVNGLPPGPPQNFQSAVVDTQATLSWQPPVTGGAPTTYVLEGGTTPGGSDLPTTPVGLVTSYVATLPVGTYYLRVRAANDFGLSTPSNEITVVIASGLPSVPGAPTGLISGVSGQYVSLYWMAPTTGGQPTGYILEAGSATGQANLATVALDSTATGVQFSGVPFGVYHLRIRAANGQGIGPASNEVVVTVSASAAPCVAPPNPPIGLTPTVQGAFVTMSWAPGPGSAPSSYRVRVGTAPGQVDLGEIAIDRVGTSLIATAPPGTYYLHLVAVNACGLSAPSNEVSLTVQTAPAPPGPVTGLTWFLGPNNTVTLQWQAAPGDVTTYLVIAGSAPGAANLAVVPTGTTATSLSVAGVGRGTYYVHVRAVNDGGNSPPSNGIVIVVP